MAATDDKGAVKQAEIARGGNFVRQIPLGGVAEITGDSHWINRLSCSAPLPHTLCAAI